MTNYYVFSDVWKINDPDGPKIRKFTSKEKARAYAIVVMNRLGKGSWSVYGDARCTRTMYEISKRKGYYSLWDLSDNRDYLVRTNGKAVAPDYSTGKPYWGQGNPKKLKAYYVKDDDDRPRFKPMAVMASDIKDFRRKILKTQLPRGYFSVFTGKDSNYLIGEIEVRAGKKYWSGFDPYKTKQSEVWGHYGEIYPSGDAEGYR